MRKLAIALLALGIILAVSSAVTAGTESWSWTATVGQTIVDWGQTATLNQFNTNGGTRVLTGVTVDLTSTINLEAGIENLTNQTATMSYGLDILASVRKGSTVLTSKNYIKNEVNMLRTARDGNVDFGGTAGHKWVYSPVTLVANTYVAPTTEFASYTGAGTVNFDVSAVTASWTPHSNVGSMAAYFLADVPTTVMVTYTYASVPEPGSFVALAAGILPLIGFGLKRRTR